MAQANSDKLVDCTATSWSFHLSSKQREAQSIALRYGRGAISKGVASNETLDGRASIGVMWNRFLLGNGSRHPGIGTPVKTQLYKAFQRLLP